MTPEINSERERKWLGIEMNPHPNADKKCPTGLLSEQEEST